MENDEIFELMTKMYAEMQEGFKDVKSDVKDLKTDVGSLKKTTLNIEQNHGKKLEALFDGYKQNAEQLTRIEKEVSKHEEVILRRIK